VENILPICDSKEMEDKASIRVTFILDLLYFWLLMGYSRDGILTKKTKQYLAAR
jgi:hypothetical protein